MLAQVVRAAAEAKGAAVPRPLASLRSATPRAPSQRASHRARIPQSSWATARSSIRARASSRLAQEAAACSAPASVSRARPPTALAATSPAAYPVPADSMPRGCSREPRKAYLLLNVEPELDTGNPGQAARAMAAAELVVALSPYQRTAHDYADVLLPITPFTETSGSFVNTEGRLQSFNPAVKPRGESRPAWKVLRVLGNLLELTGFAQDRSEQVRDDVGTARVDRRPAVERAGRRGAGAGCKAVPGDRANRRRADLLRRSARAAGAVAADDRRRRGAARGRQRRAPRATRPESRGPGQVRQGGGEAVLARARRRASPTAWSALRPRIRRPRRSGACSATSRSSGSRHDLLAMDVIQMLAGYSTSVFGPTWGPPLWTLVKTLVLIVAIAMPLILSVAYLTLAERKVIGYMQVRIGPEPGRPDWACSSRSRMSSSWCSKRSSSRPARTSSCSSSRPIMALSRRWRRGRWSRSPGVVLADVERRAALHDGDDLDGRLRRDHRRLGLEFEVRVPRRDALGGADRRPTRSRWASRWWAC